MAVDRRAFLVGLSGAGLTLPLLRTLPLRAESGSAEPKVVFFMFTGPWHTDSLLPTARDYNRGLTFDTRAIESYESLHDHLKPIGTLSQSQKELYAREIQIIDGTGTGGHHAKAKEILTARDHVIVRNGGRYEYYSTGESVDRYIARQWGSHVFSLSLRARSRDDTWFSFSDRFQSIRDNNGDQVRVATEMPPIQAPYLALDELGGLEAPLSSAFQSADRRRLLLGAAERDLRELRGRLPESDRERLRFHLQNLESLAQDISERSGLNCGARDSLSYPSQQDDAPYHEARNFLPLMLDYNRLLVQGLACGYARVGSVQTAGFASGMGGMNIPEYDISSYMEYELDVTYRDRETDRQVTTRVERNQYLSWHGMAHLVEGMGGAGNGFPNRGGIISRDHPVARQARRNSIDAVRVGNRLFLDLIEQLSNTPDVDGSSLLDNTMVVRFAPFGRNHQRGRVPWVIAGGRNLGLERGRYVRLPAGFRRRGDNFPTQSEFSQGDVCASVCEALGVEGGDRFGSKRISF